MQFICFIDPAGPLFEGSHVAARLDETDAQFVGKQTCGTNFRLRQQGHRMKLFSSLFSLSDVIHSNGENLILGGLGSWQPMGQ